MEMGLRETFMKAEKQRTIKEQLVEVIVGWLVLLVVVGLISFLYGVLFSEPDYVFTLNQVSLSALFKMSWPVILLVILLWRQIKSTKKLVTPFIGSD
jgi:hypothetical protein